MKREEEATMEPILDYFKSYFSPSEIDIAGILLELPEIVSRIDSRIRYPVRWGRKKKRSAVSCQHNTSTELRIQLPPPPQSASASLNPQPNNPEVNAVKDESTSPTTPLMFETEETPPPPPPQQQQQLRSGVVSGKRKSEDWQEEIYGLRKQKQLLQKEIQNVEDHKERLVNVNLMLQSRKQQLQKQRLIQEEAQLQIQKQSLSLDTQLAQPSTVPLSAVMCAAAVAKPEHSHHQQIVPHQYQTTMAVHMVQTHSAAISENQGCRASETQMTSTSLPCNSVTASGVTLVSCNNNGGLVRVPDCGFSFPNQNQSSPLPMMTNKAICKQRRQERSQKIRVKKTSHLGQN